MAKVPGDLRYTKEHEWARPVGSKVVVGITDHAQSELTDVVYIEFRDIKRVKKGEELAVLESVKAVSEVYSPVSGTIADFNRKLEEDPSIVNKDPYGEGWIAVVEMERPEELEELLDAGQYEAMVG